MASTVPTQERIVDPFASYNSNVVNKITQIVTQDSDGLLTTNSLQVALDSTSPTDTVVVSTGYIVKDDVVISITEDHQVNFDDPDNYISTGVWTQVGYYYVVLDYTYVKSRPAPEASIKILKPTERSFLTTSSQYCLLKVVKVEFGGLSYQIANLYNSDPENTSNAREYLKYYAGSLVDLPTFTQTRDQSRIAYEISRDKYYFGYSDGWRELSAGGISTDVNTDSTGVNIGMLCYVDENRDAQPAIATANNTGADLVVLSIGTAVAGTGRGSVAGFAENVPVESGLLIDIGDLLYLSSTEAGKITNVRTSPVYQVVGRALSQGSSTTPVDIIFSPKLVLSTGFEGQITTWLGPDGNGNYYKNIDVSSLDGTNAFDCHWFDNSDHTEITPHEVRIFGNGNVIRVSMTDSTTIVDYIISSASSVGGSGGGGGSGGVSDHALLTSLDYVSSGHTGFTPSPHNNAHHSETYITASNVTYGVLDVNGDVGTGAGQLAIGNHTHPQYVDIPSGETILFESDTTVTGYTLLVSWDDAIVYLTKGTAAGGETAGTQKSGSTWSQPNHSHAIPNEAAHVHTTSDHTLTIAEMPAHTHSFAAPLVSDSGTTYEGPEDPNDGTRYTETESTGGDGAHNHGDTGSSGSHNHGGSTDSDASANTWRPKGYNYTRQQRI